MRARADEYWSTEDLDALLKMATVTLDEAKLCHEAGAPHATLVMLGASLEAVLLGLVIAKGSSPVSATGHECRPEMSLGLEDNRDRHSSWR